MSQGDAWPFQTIVVEQADGVTTVTLRRPEVLNALNATMFDELEQVLVQVGQDPSVRAVLLTGAGDRAFAAGADIRGLLETDATSGEQLSRRGQAVFSHVERSPKPVIACVNGVALGGGCELAMACAFRLASERARFGMPEVKLGLVPGYGGTQRLPRLVGRGAALRLMLSAETIDAGEALRLGLVEEVVAADRLMERGRELAGAIAAMAPLAVAGVIEAVRPGGETLDENSADEAVIFGRLCGTADKREGVEAFLAKRPAQWEGR